MWGDAEFARDFFVAVRCRATNLLGALHGVGGRHKLLPCSEALHDGAIRAMPRCCSTSASGRRADRCDPQRRVLQTLAGLESTCSPSRLINRHPRAFTANGKSAGSMAPVIRLRRRRVGPARLELLSRARVVWTRRPRTCGSGITPSTPAARCLRCSHVSRLARWRSRSIATSSAKRVLCCQTHDPRKVARLFRTQILRNSS